MKIEHLTIETHPERLLTSLFIGASMHYPANISGQGMWLALLFRQRHSEGRMGEHMRLSDLKQVLTGEAKGKVIDTIVNAAHKAHHTLVDKPALSAQSVVRIVSEVLSASILCQSFEDTHLYALLEMLSVYMQVMEHVSGNETVDTQNPELLTRKAQIKDMVSRTFEDDQQQHILQMVDKVLFTNMPSLHTYVDARFKIFLTLTSLRPRTTSKG